jgi:toxin-antitoxin system PIN domain toxin
MSVTIDANVLIYASNAADPLHPRARELLEELAAGPKLLYVFWPAIMGYLRISTHAGVLPRPLTPAEAVGNITALIERSHVRSPGEADHFWTLYRATAGENARGNDVPDAHLAALMLQYGVATIYTRDRGFRRYQGIEPRDPFV